MKMPRPRPFLFLSLAALLAPGCRKPSEAQQFRDLVKKVQAGESAEIDCEVLVGAHTWRVSSGRFHLAS